MKKYRSNKIDLNGNMEQFQQRLLLLSMPLWFVMFPGFALSISPEFSLLALSTAACCLYGLLFLRRNQIIFEKDFLLLPGVFRRRCHYKEIESIRMEKQAIVSLKLANRSHWYKVPLRGLSQDAAGELWAMISQKLRQADIASAVREELLYRARDLDRENEIQAMKSGDEVEMVILLSNHQRLAKLISYLSKYDVIFDVGFFRAWTIFWLGFAAVILSMFSAEKLPFLNIIFALMNAFFSLISTTWESISQGAAFKIVGVFGFVLTILLTALFVLLKWRQPDSILVNKSGITPRLHVPVGRVEQTQLNWSDVAAVRLRSEKSKSDYQNHDAVLEIVPRTDRLPLEIPLRAFAGERLRSQFLEALQSWGSAAEVSPKALELLSPANDLSYTELWLSSLQSAPQLSQLTPLSAGDRLEHHSLIVERQLASGGQGVTYLAQITDTDETVVLKEMILPIYIDSARKRITERFERDAKLLKSLDHDQIVKLHDYFVEGHRAFLMLEYIEGQTLREKILLEGPMSEIEVIEHARQMLAILGYLHSRTPAVVHRDFTPDNLLLNAKKEIKLLDFDVALETDGNLISKATIVGKQNFLPPEQFRGHPCPQSDFYAMGASLYFMLTGTEPGALQASRPKTVNHTVSKELDLFVSNCTEPELQNRFATVVQMSESLKDIGVLA